MLKSFLKVFIGSIRNYGIGKNLKKFYKNVSVAQFNKNEFQILIDSKPLKTPSGKVLTVDNESLAYGIAHEWDSQKEYIKRYNMHLTTLCNTAIDNPTARNPETVVNGMLEYLDTDTICYRCREPEDLYQFQCLNWDPILDLVQRQYGITPLVTDSIVLPKMPDDSRIIIEKMLLSNNFWALTGYQHCIETLKSVYLSIALVDHYVSVEQAVRLSRLEQEYQIRKWGNIPWYHEVEELEMKSRVAASVLLIYTSQNKQYSINKSST